MSLKRIPVAVTYMVATKEAVKLNERAIAFTEHKTGSKFRKCYGSFCSPAYADEIKDYRVAGSSVTAVTQPPLRSENRIPTFPPLS